MRKKDRYAAVVNWFTANMPVAGTELHYGSAFQLLVAVVLSAQCTDKRVNVVTPPLFEKYPTAETMAEATFEELLPYVKSVSYPNSKCRHLIEMAKLLSERYGGEVPQDIEDLMALPGVGRKTANVVASIVYNTPVIAVDTHVFRVSRRIGLSDGKTAEAVEKELETNIPESKCAVAHHWLILHGRYVCTARSPKCGDCGLSDCCRDYVLRNTGPASSPCTTEAPDTSASVTSRCHSSIQEPQAG